MPLKRTELAKNKFLKTNNAMRKAATPDRFADQTALPDRREQRKLDQAAGLIPFAVKLNSDLVKQIQTLAQSRQIGINELVAELLGKALEETPSA